MTGEPPSPTQSLLPSQPLPCPYTLSRQAKACPPWLHSAPYVLSMCWSYWRNKNISTLRSCKVDSLLCNPISPLLPQGLWMLNFRLQFITTISRGLCILELLGHLWGQPRELSTKALVFRKGIGLQMRSLNLHAPHVLPVWPSGSQVVSASADAVGVVFTRDSAPSCLL